MGDLCGRLRHHIQLTDGHRAYLKAIEDSFDGDIDYTMSAKQYGEPSKLTKARYSPSYWIGIKKDLRLDILNKAYISLRRSFQPLSADAHAPYTRLTISIPRS